MFYLPAMWLRKHGIALRFHSHLQLVKIKELDNLRGYVSLGYSRTYGKQGIASVLNREDSRQLPSTPKQLRNLPFGLSSFRKIRKNKVQPE
ncbi:unnamed protein product, partial [Brassica oleracea var. botrytis]